MQWCFMQDGKKMIFSADYNSIAGFCAGASYWNFHVDAWPTNIESMRWNKSSNFDNPLPDVKALFEAVLSSCNTAFVQFCDVAEYNEDHGEDGSGVAYGLFKDIKEGTVAGDFSYVVDHSPVMFNWNSGNKCVIMTARLTDLRGRWSLIEDDDGGTMPCGCCNCCGCSCDPIEG